MKTLRPGGMGAVLSIALLFNSMVADGAEGYGITKADTAALAAKGIPFIDCHVHLRGGMTVEKAEARQEALGIKLGVLRNIGEGWPIETDAQLRAFLEGVSGQPVYAGLQVNDRDWHKKHAPALLERLDFVLGDTMIMPMPDDDGPCVKLFKPDTYTIDDPAAWMERYVKHNLRVLAEPIDILANPTYLPPAVEDRYDELWTDERMKTVIRAAIDNNVALEINARSGYPSERFIRHARKMGARFTFGSNNFDDKPIDLSRCFKAIAKYDLGKDELFVPVAAAPALSIEPVNPKLSAEGRELLAYFRSIYQRKLLSGYNVYVHTPDDYGQTGKQAAVWGRDIRWLGDCEEVVAHAKRHRYILTLHWHWFFNEDSAWTAKRKTPVDVGRIVTPGTAEHGQALKEMDAAADKLQVCEDAGIPVLWRPLHEIDGGWFWWTDKKNPAHTAALWRMMFDHFTKVRKLDNLIWVYSAGVGKKTAEERKGFYPGSDYVDISGIDIYGTDFKTADPKYREYYKVMQEVSPGKMLACGEGDAIPDPDLIRKGELPGWLYVLPWWGAPSHRRPADWALRTMRNEYVLTLEDLPAFGKGNIAPHVGILEPIDDGSAWFPYKTPEIEAYAVDRDGRVVRVDFFAGDVKIGTRKAPPYRLSWSDAPAGCHQITAVATDDAGATSRSNSIRVAVGLTDLARGMTVVASSGEDPVKAVDGDYFSAWASAKSDKEWIYVDLGAACRIDRVNLHWGWKIHPAEFAVDVSLGDPKDPASWKEVKSVQDRPYQTWEAIDHVRFPSTMAQFVRLRTLERAGNQKWAGYQLTALEVPVEAK